MSYYVIATLSKERLAGSLSFELALRYASEFTLERDIDTTVIDDKGVKRARCFINAEGGYEEELDP